MGDMPRINRLIDQIRDTDMMSRRHAIAHELRHAVAALDAATARAVGVKPLVFADEYGDGMLTSRETGKLKRVIPQNSGGFYASSLSTKVYPTAEAAVAAYRADHVAFVLRCLHPASPLSAGALLEWLHRETLDIVTGEPLFDDAHVDVTAGEVRRRIADITHSELLAAAAELAEVRALVKSMKDAMTEEPGWYGKARAALAPFARKAGV